ncbi:hypothetical protein C8F04DRAFT_1301977 [Mycena alexandri]|uniref:HMG box domain-containing protein n=1 Tax=Mycena alexandri TaxID=1745969 RepID=A0AAD6SAY2_9AGAR|nr:hypothetical protein C8F04DRAFT_1301977 [Mycena alexandri]
MPAVRLSSRRGSAIGRRRSSLAIAVKPGVYGYSTAPPTSASAVTFAPNVTPISYSAPSPTPSPYGSPSLTTDLPLPLFPPSATPAPPPTRRRLPPGKRRSQGYVPRPPNAFMLFRADFVRQKHVPGSIETNHGSLSKIIGNCWRALPLAEKHIWETKAKHAKAEHKLKYPDYKFRPVHNKRGAAGAASAANPAPPPPQPAPRTTSAKGQLSPQEDERRCEEVAALLLQGKKGEELASAVRDLDWRRQAELAHSTPSPVPAAYHHQNSKYPHPLQLDPHYYPHGPASPPSSTLTSSHASGSASGAGSPYSLPMPLQQDPTWRHRRSSSVPLPNDYAYTFPPFMYDDSAPGTGSGIALPSMGGFPAPSNGFTLPPPPSAGDDSLAGLPPSISGPGRMSFSWAGTGGSSFSYPRPSFSFGSNFGGGGARGSFSFAGAFGGAWGGNGPVGRRASSAQAFFAPSAFSHEAYQQQHHHQQHGQHGQQQEDEELPDADTSLFEAGFLNSFGASASASASASPVSEPISPFDPAFGGQGEQQMLHAPQPVHAVSPLGGAFASDAQAQGYHGYMDAPTASAPYAEHDNQHAQAEDEGQRGEEGEDEETYTPFEFPMEEATHFARDLRASSLDMGSPAREGEGEEMRAAYESYANEFV